MEYNINHLFRTAFGINAPIYMADVYSSDDSNGKINYTGVEYAKPEKAKKLSWMGTPIIFPIVIPEDTFKVYAPNGEIEDRVIPAFDMPATSLVDFSRAKNITRTPVMGNNGTVKEIYGFDDWSIRIRGICLNEPKIRTAKDQVKHLLKYEKVAGSIMIIGEQFQEKEILAITIKSIDFQQVQGKPDVIPFEIRAVSDEPLILVYEKTT